MLNYRLEGKVCVIQLNAIDLSNSFKEFQESIQLIRGQNEIESILIDLKNIEAVDTKGIGIIVYTHNNFKEEGVEIGLCHLNSQITEMLHITGIERLINIYSTEEEALTHM